MTFHIQGIIQAGTFGFDTGDDIFKHSLATRRGRSVSQAAKQLGIGRSIAHWVIRNAAQ